MEERDIEQDRNSLAGDFTLLKAAISANDHDKFVELLRQCKDLQKVFQMSDLSQNRSLLLHACAGIALNLDEPIGKSVSIRTFRMLFEVVGRVFAGKDHLARDQLWKRDKHQLTCFQLVCQNAPSDDFVEFFVDKIFDFGHRNFLREQLEIQSSSYSSAKNPPQSILGYLVKNSHSLGDSMFLLRALLIYSGNIFDKHLNALDDVSHRKMKFEIDVRPLRDPAVLIAQIKARVRKSDLERRNAANQNKK